MSTFKTRSCSLCVPSRATSCRKARLCSRLSWFKFGYSIDKNAAFVGCSRYNQWPDEHQWLGHCCQRTKRDLSNACATRIDASIASMRNPFCHDWPPIGVKEGDDPQRRLVGFLLHSAPNGRRAASRGPQRHSPDTPPPTAGSGFEWLQSWWSVIPSFHPPHPVTAARLHSSVQLSGAGRISPTGGAARAADAALPS